MGQHLFSRFKWVHWVIVFKLTVVATLKQKLNTVKSLGCTGIYKKSLRSALCLRLGTYENHGVYIRSELFKPLCSIYTYGSIRTIFWRCATMVRSFTNAWLSRVVDCNRMQLRTAKRVGFRALHKHFNAKSTALSLCEQNTFQTQSCFVRARKIMK